MDFDLIETWAKLIIFMVGGFAGTISFCVLTLWGLYQLIRLIVHDLFSERIELIHLNLSKLDKKIGEFDGIVAYLKDKTVASEEKKKNRKKKK